MTVYHRNKPTSQLSDFLTMSLVKRIAFFTSIWLISTLGYIFYVNSKRGGPEPEAILLWIEYVITLVESFLWLTQIVIMGLFALILPMAAVVEYQ